MEVVSLNSKLRQFCCQGVNICQNSSLSISGVKSRSEASQINFQ